MDEIGKKFREARKRMGATLSEVTQKAGCTPAFLSQVERGLTDPSLSMLRNIANALQVNITELFTQSLPEKVVVKKNERLQIKTPASKVVAEVLAPGASTRKMEGRLKIIQPGGGSNGVYCHNGEELGFVIKGSLDLTLNGKEYHLEEGDSFYYDSTYEHGFKNKSKTKTIVLWVSCPPGF